MHNPAANPLLGPDAGAFLQQRAFGRSSVPFVQFLLESLAPEGVFTTAVSAETNTTGTPTMTAIKYSRAGNVVTMSGQFTADPVLTATATSFEFTLPIASNLGAASDVSGVAMCGVIAGMVAEVRGSAANDTAEVRWISSDITSQTWSWFAQYRVL